MDSLINLPNLVNLETGEIKWDLIKELSGETTEEMKKLKCKKCNKIFFVKIITEIILYVKTIEIIRLKNQ